MKSAICRGNLPGMGSVVNGRLMSVQNRLQSIEFEKGPPVIFPGAK